MHTLFAISILAFIVLLMAGVAIVRHVRISRNVAPPETRRDFAQHYLMATENPPTPHAVTHRLRSLPSQTIHEITANKSWNHPTETILQRPDPDAAMRYIPETVIAGGINRASIEQEGQRRGPRRIGNEHEHPLPAPGSRYV